LSGDRGVHRLTISVTVGPGWWKDDENPAPNPNFRWR
jgi:hypothetical protein